MFSEVVTIPQRSQEGHLCRAIGYEYAHVTELLVSDTEQDGSQQCGISLMADGSQCQRSLVVDIVVVEDESAFTDMTDCGIHEG